MSNLGVQFRNKNKVALFNKNKLSHLPILLSSCLEWFNKAKLINLFDATVILQQGWIAKMSLTPSALLIYVYTYM